MSFFFQVVSLVLFFVIRARLNLDSLNKLFKIDESFFSRYSESGSHKNQRHGSTTCSSSIMINNCSLRFNRFELALKRAD